MSSVSKCKKRQGLSYWCLCFQREHKRPSRADPFHSLSRKHLNHRWVSTFLGSPSASIQALHHQAVSSDRDGSASFLFTVFFHVLFLVVRPENQHRPTPYLLFNHKQMVQTNDFKQESFKSCSYTPMELSRLVVVSIIMNLAGYFRQLHLKILTSSQFCFI